VVSFKQSSVELFSENFVVRAGSLSELAYGGVRFQNPGTVGAVAHSNGGFSSFGKNRLYIGAALYPKR